MDIALDKVIKTVLRLRAVELKDGATDADSGSNPIDNRATDVLVSGTGDTTEQEIRSMLAGLNEDERFARERAAEGKGAAKELHGSPDAGDLLEEGLDPLGIVPEPPEA